MNYKKPIVLIFVKHYIPGYKGGGPIRSISNMVNRLSKYFSFLIVTSDRDLGDKNPYPGIKNNVWTNVNDALILYTNPKQRSLIGLKKIIDENPHDILYLNSFFDWEFTLIPLLIYKLSRYSSKKIILAPRGEFSLGALSIKRFKKSIFIFLTSKISLYSVDLTWHGSTNIELSDISNALGALNNNNFLASNLLAAPDLIEIHHTVNIVPSKNILYNSNRRLLLCFISRISPKKNLDFALRVLSKVKAPVLFSIYGPIESQSYWSQCEALIRDLPKHIEVKYGGPIEYSNVKSILYENDVFFLPTKGENFGHVFLESLSVGVPIITSDQTPWRELSEKGLGWDISLNKPNDYVEALDNAAKWSEIDKAKMYNNCINFYTKVANDPEALQANLELFNMVLYNQK